MPGPQLFSQPQPLPLVAGAVSLDSVVQWHAVRDYM